MFDPASFFGHSEFELAIMDMFGGFQEPFWTAYHAKVRVCLMFAPPTRLNDWPMKNRPPQRATHRKRFPYKGRDPVPHGFL